MKWPQSVSPYDCAIIPFLNKGDKKNLDKAINIRVKKVKRLIILILLLMILRKIFHQN